LGIKGEARRSDDSPDIGLISEWSIFQKTGLIHLKDGDWGTSMEIQKVNLVILSGIFSLKLGRVRAILRDPLYWGRLRRNPQIGGNPYILIWEKVRVIPWVKG